MELVPCAEDDLALTVALETDPETMRHLGGPVSVESAEQAHRRRLADDTAGWWLKVVPGPGPQAAGLIGIWLSDWEGREIHEAAWMLLAEFRGRGLAREAVVKLLERARAEPSMTQVHAFPNVENPASNALCRSLGFRSEGESDAEFRGTPLHVRHWLIDVAGDEQR